MFNINREFETCPHCHIEIGDQLRVAFMAGDTDWQTNYDDICPVCHGAINIDVQVRPEFWIIKDDTQ
jgi:hypothetical protein